MRRCLITLFPLFAVFGGWCEEPEVAEDSGNSADVEKEAAEISAPEDDGNGSRLLFDIRNGRFRVELSGQHSIDDGPVDRDDDWNLRGTVTYEVPLVRHVTTGLRAMPLFYWDQNTEEGGSIWAFGAGTFFRAYTKPTFEGLYGEVGLMGTVLTRKFQRNNGRGLFLPEASVGYQFNNGLDIAFKYQHLSNAGLTFPNSGVDSVGLSLGYAFKWRESSGRRK